MKWAAAAVFGYETAAITTGRAPTFSTLCRRHPWLRLALIAALGVHLWRETG